jgi:hypothetical protein
MIESQPDLASQIRRVRGGYLKIQGTWMPYEVLNPTRTLLLCQLTEAYTQVALRLSRR